MKKSTTTARPTWREREQQKERQKREEAARAVEEAQRKKIAKTEENFPTMIQATVPTTTMPVGKFAELATKWQVDEETILRHARNERERTIIRNTILFVRSRGVADRSDYSDEEDDDPLPVVNETLEERFPPHGRRGHYSPPDSEGWRLVTKKQRRKPRMLTEAELAQKYRDAYLAGDGVEEDQDVNGDLHDRNQRRDFY